jgi:hypothetical protein
MALRRGILRLEFKVCPLPKPGCAAAKLLEARGFCAA